MKVTDPAEQRRVYELIWSQMPAMQKRTSSTWWFFVLLPKGPEGYGPNQMMFASANRAGERVRINDVWLRGLDLQRPVVNGLDRFQVLNTGWYCDGKTVHEHLIRHSADAVLSSEGYLEAWSMDEAGQCYGGEIRASDAYPLALEAHYRGPGGGGRFTAWGDLNTVDTSPHEAVNIDSYFGGTHFIAWRLMHFEGDFWWPGGAERLSGLGYFQRVCLNIPAFPWKWIWALFEDGTLFSAYVPYVGLNLFRKGYRLFSREWMERTTLSILPGAYWDPAGPEERFLFDHVRVTPRLTGREYPSFEVFARRRGGDFISFIAEPYGRTRSFVDRPLLGGEREAHWNYNEFMFRMAAVEGSINGRLVSHRTMGNGFGSLEYTYGLAL